MTSANREVIAVARPFRGEDIPTTIGRAVGLWGYAFLVIVPIFGFWTGYRELIALGRLPSSDEAMYYLWGLEIWRDLSQHQLYAFLRDTYHQQIIPFMGSHLFALGMFIGGPTVETARIMNLVAGSAAALALAGLSASIARRQQVVAAGLTAAVWGVSPMHLVASSHVLLDAFALLFTALSLVGAVRFVELPNRRWALVCGFSAALSFLTKYNIGSFLILSILLGLVLPRLRDEFVYRRQGVVRVATHPWTLLAISLILPVGLWLSLSGLRMVAAYARGYPFQPLGISENLLFYPRALFQVFFSHPALALLPIGGFLYWAWASWFDRRAIVPWIYVALYLCTSSVHPQKDPRFVLVAVAIAVALAAAAVANVLGNQKRALRVSLHGGLFLAAVGSVTAAPGALREQYGASWVGFSVESESVNRSALAFYKINARTEHTLVFVGSGSLNPEIVRVWLSDADAHRIPRVDALPYPGFPQFHGWGFSTEKSPRYQDLLESYLRAEPDADILVAKFSEDSPLKGALYPYLMAWQENYVVALEHIGDWHVVAERQLPLGLSVMIYRKTGRPVGQQMVEVPR